MTTAISILDRKLVAENSKFNIYFDHVLDLAGHEVPNYLVVSPKLTGRNLVTGVGILPLMNDQVGLIRMYRPALRSFSWEIPHGFVDEGEQDRTAAIRELMEETGLTTGELSELGYMTPDSGIVAARVHLYLADNCAKTDRAVGEVGLRELQFFSISEFQKMVRSSEIQDSFTLSAWCKYVLTRA